MTFIDIFMLTMPAICGISSVVWHRAQRAPTPMERLTGDNV